MRRLYTSYVTPGQGAVYRELEDCPSGATCAQCIAETVVPVLPGVGCTPDFPEQTNEYGKLPTSFPPDVEIDTEDFDVRLSALDGISYNASYPDMWGLLDPQPVLQEDILEADCYCPGDGIRKPGLTTGRPQFPVVAPLNFFWFPALDIPPPLVVREINPDEILPGDCCPNEQQLANFIRAEIVGNEIQLKHVREGDLEERYRTEDTDITFQARAGFPRWCCMENECDSSGVGADLEPTHVLKWLHFPRWPSEDRNPYDEMNPQEPLGLIPFIPDIQCDPATGILHIYHANLIVHDGIIADLQWDTEEPREYPGQGDPTVAPLNPLDLEINKDYQGNEIYDEARFAASSDALLGEFCDENCDQAIANMLRTEEACEPLCPQDGVICAGELPNGFIGYGTGATPGEANSAAVADLQDTTQALGYCDPLQIIYLCYTIYDADAMQYVAEAKGCCPDPP